MFFRSASFCASSVMNLSASLPVPPYGVNTRGLKEPCSISITRWLYIRFFSFSLLLKAVSSFWFRWLFANGLNTLTSKNAFCPFCQIPRALKSNRASSDELAPLLSTSPVSVSRCGSTSTSWHTSLRRVANRSRTNRVNWYFCIYLIKFVPSSNKCHTYNVYVTTKIFTISIKWMLSYPSNMVLSSKHHQWSWGERSNGAFLGLGSYMYSDIDILFIYKSVLLFFFLFLSS